MRKWKRCERRWDEVKEFIAIVLAAGEGKRMKSNQSKVLHKILGKPIIKWVYDSIKRAGVEDCIFVVGHKSDQVKEYLGEEKKYAMQDKQLGTGHAVMQAKDQMKDYSKYVIVLCGDTPMITELTIQKTMEFHKQHNNSATVITAQMKDPTGYGRIIRSGDDDVLRIVEHKDATVEELAIDEVNSGMYCFTTEHLIEMLGKLGNDNSQGEYYLTDTLELLIKSGRRVGAIKVDDPSEIFGVNDRVHLAEATEILKTRTNEKFMRAGVTIIDPKSTFIAENAKIGLDTIIYPGTIIEGDAQIGQDCIIGPNTKIVSTCIGDRTEVNESVVLESTIGNDTKIGPFAYIRPHSKIGSKVKIGDFVEVKAAVIGDKTKISHLSYVGDAEIGQNCNLGCGVVVVNYDGQKKHKTIVEDNAFVGCNVNLVSPVVVKENAYIAAGSTITDEVPTNALAIARARQVNKEDWVIKKGRKR
jgi:bifunctional UDP-N-acetylglucosamine pyrophosphorylase/glucosamine-1-phosphate N-acetyltransferase